MKASGRILLDGIHCEDLLYFDNEVIIYKNDDVLTIRTKSSLVVISSDRVGVMPRNPWDLLREFRDYQTRLAWEEETQIGGDLYTRVIQ
jgi:hypothetical protein